MNILITGASKGIGRELVKQFSKLGNNYIIAVARSKNLLQTLQAECKNDVNSEISTESIDFLANNFESTWYKIIKKYPFHFDVIINNAGLLYNKPFTTTTTKEIEATFKVNFIAPSIIIKSIFPYLDKKQPTRIINIGSMGGFQGSVKFPGLSIYSASKAALANLTECLAEEFLGKKISINCLALGSVQTEMLNQAFPNFKAHVSATEMATLIVDFALNKTKYFNGKIIPISCNTP